MSIQTFKDLIAWQKSRELALSIYQATSTFPVSEQFGLTNQLRRAAVSIVSNIAEGFGRRTASDRAHFYDMARASLYEVQAQLILANDIGFVSAKDYTVLEDKGIECHKLLTGLINKTKGTSKDS